jgi:diguanylate cyclase (GGDEF)-like protein
VERLQLINSRFGYAAGDQVLISFAEHLRRNVSSEDQIFRWGAAGFVVLFEREMGEEEFHAELSRIASQRLEKTVQIGGRSVLLPVSAHWSMLPIYAEATLEKLVRRIDKFLSDVRS